MRSHKLVSKDDIIVFLRQIVMHVVLGAATGPIFMLCPMAMRAAGLLFEMNA